MLPKRQRNIAIVIPARSKSRRLPGKLLLAETGKPLIQHVYEAAKQSRLATTVTVAAADERIAQAVREFGGECEVIPRDCANGTERVIWAAKAFNRPPEIIVNLQADEPEITGLAIDSLIHMILTLPRLSIATLVGPLEHHDDADPHTVKVAVNAAGEALYFSRAPLAGARRHVGIYAFHSAALTVIRRMASSILAEAEDLEQITWLSNGLPIHAGYMQKCPRGINTREDYRAFVDRFKQRQSS